MLLDLFLLSSHILFSATLPVNFHPTTVLLFISSIFSMGGSISSSSSDERTQERSGTTSQGLGDLPESCITSILVHLDPLDICRLARLSRAFRGASFADIVWDPKLPLNYKFLVEKVLGEGLENLGKRDIYTRLCRPNQFDGGAKELWLDKVSGDMFLSISSRALKITRVDDRRYWSHISTEESRFGTVAYLRQIWWVEVVGETEFEFSPGNYSLYFRIQLGKTVKRFGRRVCNLDEVHGWDIKPVRFQLSTSDGQESTTERYLQSRGSWGCYHVGDFRVESSKAPVRVKFSMVQIDCTHTKGGLSVDSVIICTSEMKTRLKLDS